MSSEDGGAPAFDHSANTGQALGAFFGMVGFNLVLVAIALILRRVTRSKETQGNSVEMKNGKFNKKKASLVDDIEKGEDASNLHSTAEEKPAAKAAAGTSFVNHDNGAFVDIDLESDSKEKSDAVYESRNQSEEANKDNDYSQLTDVTVAVKSEPEDTAMYENYDGGASNAAISNTSEAGVNY